MKIVILAGGGGTRLWPVSRKSKPKQIQPFIGNKTLLQKTYERQRRGFKRSDIFVSTNVKSWRVIQRQLPQLPRSNFILEPAKRDTAAAIGLAAVTVAKRHPRAVLMSVGSDHYIKNEQAYIKILKLAEKTINEDSKQSLLIGIRPTYAETGYGYIKINKLYKQVDNFEVFYGQRFVEKPDLKTAQQYIKSWDYLWNTNMFCWRVDYLLQLYKKFLPTHYRSLMRINNALGTKNEKKVINTEFKKLKPVSIDYGIMERTRKIIVIPAAFGWADIGHWRAVKDILSKRPEDNVIRGKHLAINSHNNLIYSYSGKLIATADVKNMIIIDMEDCLLVCSKERAHEVKKIVEQLEKKKMKKYL